MEMAKYSVWGIWIGGAAAILFGDASIARIGHMAVWLTLAAHILEFLVMRGVLEKAGGSMTTHFIGTLIYGLFYWMPIKKRVESGAA